MGGRILGAKPFLDFACCRVYSLSLTPHTTLQRALQIPGGISGVVALAVGGPLLALGAIKYFGLVSFVFHFVPVGFIVAIVYAERTLASHEE